MHFALTNIQPACSFLRVVSYVCVLNQPVKAERMLYKRWKPFSGNKTKAGAERTGNGISIINKGIGLPQTTFRGSLQTTLCCVGRKLPRW